MTDSFQRQADLLVKSYADEITAMCNDENADIYEWLNQDVLDIEYTVDSGLNYSSSCLILGSGGPNIYLNTKTQAIELYWSTTESRCPLSADVIEIIDNMMKECYEINRM